MIYCYKVSSSCCLSIVNWLVFLNDCLADENFIKHRSDWHVACEGLVAGWNNNHHVCHQWYKLLNWNSCHRLNSQAELVNYYCLNHESGLTCLNFCWRIQPKKLQTPQLSCVCVPLMLFGFQVNFNFDSSCSVVNCVIVCVLDLWCVVVFLGMLGAMVVTATAKSLSRAMAISRSFAALQICVLKFMWQVESVRHLLHVHAFDGGGRTGF